MAEQQPMSGSVWGLVADEVGELVSGWRARAEAAEAPGTPGLLGALANDPEQLDFTRRLIDSLFSVDDAFASALGLREVSQGDLPEGMPASDRLLLRAGGVASLGLPWVVRPAARRRLLSRLPEVLLPIKVTGKLSALAEMQRGHADRGLTLVASLFGDPVYGPQGGEAEVDRLVSLASNPAVRRLAFDPARIAPRASDWSIEADLLVAAARMRPLLVAALEHGVKLLVEPRDTVWARHVPELLTHALADTAFDRVDIGAKVFAELPESWETYSTLHRFARRRVADGGAPLDVVIGFSNVAARERVAAIHTGLPVPVIEAPTERAAQLLRLIEIALQPSRAAVLRPIIASEDPWVLFGTVRAARELGAAKLFGLQLRCGVANVLAEHLATELRDEIPEVRLHLPIVPRGNYGEAVEVLVALIAEAVGGESADYDRAVLLADHPPALRHRMQLRDREWDPSERDSALFYRAPDQPTTQMTGGLTAAVLGLTRGATGEISIEPFVAERPIPVVSRSGFANEPPTDGSLNREWARGLLRGASETALEGDRIDATVALSPADLDPKAAARETREAAARWYEQSHDQRAVRLRRSALATAAARDRIVTALAAQTGAPFPELDAAVNQIIDAARYAGQLADGLRVVRGADFVSDRLVLVVADASAPLATQATVVLGVLGSGAGVLWAVPPGMLRSAAICVEEWEVGGLTSGAVRPVSVVDDATFAALGESPDVDRAIVLGARALGRDLARRRPDLRVEGHFSTRSSTLVTATAERGRAIADIVDSAFRGTQTRLATAAGVILLGGVSRSSRFKRELADAVRALRVGDSARPGAADPLTFDLGPISAPLSPEGRAALTELAPGEEWLVKPEQLDDEGLLWSPGVKLGVAPGSPFWDDARGLPVIGVSHAALLGDAISQQNAAGSGAVAAIQSWDRVELLSWLDRVEAASLFVNRPSSGLRIERQPSGGWNESVMGLSTLSGGPHWLLTQGSWARRLGHRSETLHLRGLAPEVILLIEAAQPELAYEEFDELRRAALADQLTWKTSLGLCEDELELGIERNVLRVSPVTVHVRLAEDGSLAELLRVLAAALLTRSPIAVSTGIVLPPAVADVLAAQGIEVSLERDDDWLARLAVAGPEGPGGSAASRVRLIGGDRVRAAEWMGGLDRAALWAEPVTMAGPVELLVFVREQSISARAERHGLAELVPGVDELLD